MKRLATTVAIAAWIGFLGVFSFELAADILAPGLLDAASALAWPPALRAQFGGVDAVLGALAPSAKPVIAGLCLAISALFAGSLYWLHAPRRANAGRGETLALVAIGAIAVLAGVAQLISVPLLPIDTEGGLVWLSIALSIAAVVFDRLVTIEDDEEDEAEAEFHAGLSALAERMGRQAALYPWSDAPSESGGKARRP